MAQFTDTIAGTFDAKKMRLSVPAPFRAVLNAAGTQTVVLRRSSHAACIDCWPEPDFAREIQRRTDELDPFSEDYDERMAELVGRATTLTMDGDGRLVLPRALVEHAGLAGEISFAGRSKFFQIWSTPALDAHEAKRRAAK